MGRIFSQEQEQYRALKGLWHGSESGCVRGRPTFNFFCRSLRFSLSNICTEGAFSEAMLRPVVENISLPHCCAGRLRSHLQYTNLSILTSYFWLSE